MRSKNTIRRIGFALLSVVLLAVGVFAALAVGLSVHSAAEGERLSESVVWQPVESGQLRREASVTALGVRPEPTPVPSSASGTVLDVSVQAGNEVANGDRLAMVDGRPIVAVDSAVFVPYRDLRFGDSGPDVEELQRFLASVGLYGDDIDDRFGPSLRIAVERFYREHGLPKQKEFLLDTVLPLETPAIAASVAVSRGVAVEKGAVLFTQHGGEAVVRGLVADDGSAPFQVGTAVTVDSSDGEVPGRVATLGDVVESDQGTSVRTLEVVLDGTPVVSGRNYLVSALVEVSAEDALLVPALAVQTNVDGQLRVRARRAGEIEGRPIDIEVQMTNGRRVAVSGDGLDAGMEVLVSQ